jgi:tRNA(adenine34) deaminase
MGFDVSIDDRKIYFMKKALVEAEKCLKNGDVPVGVVIVKRNEIIAYGHNQVEQKTNSLAHAEITAINKAIKTVSYKHLLDCEMYVTLEPCSMCAGAIVLARIPKLFIGTSDPKTGACGSVFNLANNEKLNHRCEIETGILQNECSNLLRLFFRELREIK